MTLPADLEVRLARPADVPGLAQLVVRCDATHRSWAGEVPVPAVADEEAEWHMRLTRAGAWTRVVVEPSGRIVGSVAFAAAREQRHHGPLVPGLAHVSAVFVDPDRWREGIARGLVELAEEAMREHGYDRAQLWTLEGSPAERLYESMGWRRDGRRDIYPRMDLPIVAYVKAL